MNNLQKMQFKLKTPKSHHKRINGLTVVALLDSYLLINQMRIIFLKLNIIAQ